MQESPLDMEYAAEAYALVTRYQDAGQLRGLFCALYVLIARHQPEWAREFLRVIDRQAGAANGSPAG